MPFKEFNLITLRNSPMRLIVKSPYRQRYVSSPERFIERRCRIRNLMATAKCVSDNYKHLVRQTLLGRRGGVLPPSRLPACLPACPLGRNINYRASSVAHVSRVTRVDTANTNGARRTRMTIIVFAQITFPTTYELHLGVKLS